MIEMILKGQTLVVHALNFVVQLPQLLFVITRVSNKESDDKVATIHIDLEIKINSPITLLDPTYILSA